MTIVLEQRKRDLSHLSLAQARDIAVMEVQSATHFNQKVHLVQRVQTQIRRHATRRLIRRDL